MAPPAPDPVLVQGVKVPEVVVEFPEDQRVMVRPDRCYSPRHLMHCEPLVIELRAIL